MKIHNRCPQCGQFNCICPLEPRRPSELQFITGPTGLTGNTGSKPALIETNYIGAADALIAYNQGSGVNEALGALIFTGSQPQTVAQMSAYVLQPGNTAGVFQMAILQPTGIVGATVIAATAVASYIAPGIFTLPLAAPVTLASGSAYYLAVYNQVAASQIAGSQTGIAAVADAPPMNFRAQNLMGLTVGSAIDTSDTSLKLTPWLAAF